MSKLVFLFFVFVITQLSAQVIDVKVFSNAEIKDVYLKPLNGDYQIHTKSGFLAMFPSGTQLNLRINSSGKIHVSLNGDYLSITDSLFLYQNSLEDYLNFSFSKDKFNSRKYQGDFAVFVRNGNIEFINNILLDQYFEGVLASEAGIMLESEYYKVQAIISRTYALNNLLKHVNEGFNLCDDVHCQAYFGRYEGESNQILDGVRNTKGCVLIDSKLDDFPVFYSANCGGQSAETDQIWNTSIPEYISHIDTFCIHTRQAKWEKYLFLKEFLEFLSSKYYLDVKNSDVLRHIINFKQESRKTFFLDPSFGIPLRDIRQEFGLKSTYFDLEIIGDKILFKGKGFGHGVGLCQEGAMNMIKSGKTHDQVLKYYFGSAQIAKCNKAIIYK